MMFLIGSKLMLFFRKKRPVVDNPPQIKSFDVYYTHDPVLGVDISMGPGYGPNPIFGIDISTVDGVQSSVVGFYGQIKSEIL